MLKDSTDSIINLLTMLVLGVMIGISIAAFLPAKSPPENESINKPAAEPEALGTFSPEGKFTAAEPQQPKQAETSVNYCHNADKTKEWEGMRIKYPADVGILHLYALRSGLCQAVDDKKISLETAIDVFSAEHQKLFLERAQQKDPNAKTAI